MTFTTPNGSVLPFLKMENGSLYLQVCWRMLWFREEKPTWRIETELLRSDGLEAEFKATIFGDMYPIATGHGSASKNNKKYPGVETAETKALGRALQAAGYGTARALILAGLDPSLAKEDITDDAETLSDAPVGGEVQARHVEVVPSGSDTYGTSGSGETVASLGSPPHNQAGIPMCLPLCDIRQVDGKIVVNHDPTCPNYVEAGSSDGGTEAPPAYPEGEWWRQTLTDEQFRIDYGRKPDEDESRKMKDHRLLMLRMELTEAMEHAVAAGGLPKSLKGKSEKAKEARIRWAATVLQKDLEGFNGLEEDEWQRLIDQAKRLTREGKP